ncbi:Glu-tRNA(Gln) amidotransferase subunit GatE [Candidatus Micrarchaeota archaeon]|nr:Glu-tRNA(Gln) amidotransferase subunit GatE [Candidatus Micrarchaeota archaeon]
MDYSDLGFKCGLEIHQRVNSKKLFCSCYFDPSKEEAKESPEAGKTMEAKVPKNQNNFSRRLRAVVGETGTIDPSAAFEAAKGKKFNYFWDGKNSCAVEKDEEPPQEMNKEALVLGATIAKMLGADVVDTLFVMRKTVIDGSAVSGFQRTALLALDGNIELDGIKIGIPTIALEEESCAILEKTPGSSDINYSLDRLGIPLIEIATSPTIKSGLQAMEIAKKIGGLLRATGKVQRGIGSIRQDLNISISAGQRVEIKGVQELSNIPILVDNEVKRQISLLKLRERLKERHMILGNEHFSIKNLTFAFKSTGCKLISEGIRRKEEVFGMKLQSFAGLFGEEIMPSYRFGSEVSAYVKQYSSAKGIVHSDEKIEEKYGISISEIDVLEKELNLGKEDLFVLVIGTETVCKKALRAAFDRCVQLQIGVPKETRKADGEISIFMRPLPGAARMYPETDLLPIKITREILETAQKQLPESEEEKRKKYLEWGLNEQLCEKMIKSRDWERFEKFVSGRREIAQVAALTLLESMTALKREGVAADELGDETLMEIFGMFADGKITKAAILELLKLCAENPGIEPLELVKKGNLGKFSKEEIKKLLLGLEGTPEKRFATLIKEHRLRIDAAELKQMIDGK